MIHDSPAALRQTLATRESHERFLAASGAIGCEHRVIENIRLAGLPSGILAFHGRCLTCQRALFLDRDGRGTERIEDVATYRAEFAAQLDGGPLGPVSEQSVESSMPSETATSGSQIQRTHGGNL